MPNPPLCDHCGFDWYGGEGADANHYDEVVQFALLGKLVYG